MKHKSKVYVHTFLSYLLMLVIPLVIGAVIYGYLSAVTRRQNDTINGSMLSLVKQEMDYKLEAVHKTASNLAMDQDIHLLSQVKGKFGAKDHIQIYYVNQYLQNLNLSDPFIKDVFIWFSHPDYVVGVNGGMDSRLFYQLYYENEGLPYEQFKGYIEERHFMDSRIIRRENENLELFTMTNFNSPLGEQSATIGIVIDLSELKKTLELMKWKDEMQILVVDSQNEILNRPEDLPEHFTLEYEALEAGSYLERDMLPVETQMQVLQSDQMKWKYVVMIPEKVINEDARRVRLISIIGLFGCIFTGFACSYVLTRKSYHPLQAILEMFKGSANKPLAEGENEYQWLERQAQSLFQDHTSTRQLLKTSEKNLKNYYLIRLVEYPYDEETKAALEKAELFFPQKDYVVLVVSEVLNRTDIESALYRFIIGNIFQEKLSEQFQVEVLEAGSRLACIIKIPEADSQTMQELKELIDATQLLTEEKVKVTPVVLLGAIHRGVEEIHVSYQEALELEEYIPLLDSTLISYDDVKNLQKRYVYPLDLEEKIINAIKTGNKEAANGYMDQVVDQNLTGDYSIEICRCLIFDLMGTFLKGADAGGFHSFADEFRFSKELSAKLPVPELKARLHEICGKLCDQISQMRRQTDQDDAISKRVEAYIDNNFADPDLNISLIGQQFNITPAYISAIYKKQTGGSLLDYMNTVRVKKAEALLLEGHSVAEAAVMTGFRDSGGFIRVFKKKMGITPGSLKPKS